jgi:hypothetical protein
MKWKKKGGSWRVQSGDLVACVEPQGDQFALKWRDGSGAWERGALYDNPAHARARGEDVLEAMVRVVEAERSLLERRRQICAERQAKKDSMTPEEKTISRAFQAYLSASPFERAMLLHFRPGLSEVFAEFDEVIKEIAQVEKEKS